MNGVKRVSVAAVVSVALLPATMIVHSAIAVAAPSVESHLEVVSAQLVQECSGGTQVWEVAGEIRVDNTSEETATFEWTDFWAQSRAGSSRPVQNDVDVIDAGGFVAGAEIEAGGTEFFRPVVRVANACDTTNASLYAQVKLVGSDTIFGCGSAFIEGGTAVPVGPTGILGIAVILGVAGVLAHRLDTRPRSVVPGSRTPTKDPAAGPYRGGVVK